MNTLKPLCSLGCLNFRLLPCNLMGGAAIWVYHHHHEQQQQQQHRYTREGRENSGRLDADPFSEGSETAESEMKRTIKREMTYYFTTFKFTEPWPGSFFGPWRYSDLQKRRSTKSVSEQTGFPNEFYFSVVNHAANTRKYLLHKASSLKGSIKVYHLFVILMSLKYHFHRLHRVGSVYTICLLVFFCVLFAIKWISNL